MAKSANAANRQQRFNVVKVDKQSRSVKHKPCPALSRLTHPDSGASSSKGSSTAQVAG